ncbi:hypothetical protein BGX38DRAFT_99406 [Terfezia claveryi]|nr:hypothetical protein BGX38DRAFT_99406 [Terfezia claveryi]
MQQNSAAPLMFPFYPQFLYGGHTAVPTSPRNAKIANGAQEHPPFITGYYPHVEGHAGQPVPNPELLHPHFGTPFDGHYNSYMPQTHYGGQSPQSQERFNTAGYGSERYESSHDSSVASQGGIQA